MDVEYRILVKYSTGDSFKNEDTSDYLELTWKDIAIAKENLSNISEHYKMYRAISNDWKKRSGQYADNKSKDWFVNVPKLFCISSNYAIDEKDKARVGENNWEYRPDYYYAEHCINLKTDIGTKMQMSCFWTGYFESLYSVEIEVVNDGMKIEF